MSLAKHNTLTDQAALMLPMLGLKHLPRSDSLRRALYFSFPLVSMARPDILLQGKVPIKEVEKVRLKQLISAKYTVQQL